MRYRWGFDESGVFTECKPIIEDSTSLDYAQQSGEVFYRAKLNGTLSFRFEFDAILAKGYNYTHIIVLQYFDESQNDWAECWRGRFTLTDCEIDYDTNTINVQPETLDRYTKILDGLENEYNLLKILPTQQPVKMQIRPVVQIYSIGSSKITNITTNGYYEQDVREADPQIFRHMMQSGTGADTFYFAVPFEIGSGNVICMPKAACSLWVTDSNDESLFFFAEFPLDGTYTNKTDITNAQVYTYDAQTGVKTIVATINAECYFDILDNHHDTYFRFYYNGGTFELYYETEEVGAEDPTEANLPAGYTFVKARANQFVSRILLNTDADSVTWNGVTVPTVDLDQTTDIAPIANYNKIAPIDITSIVAEAEFQEAVTEFGIADNDGYFKKYAGGGYYHRPINISEWCLHSMWGRPVANGLDDYNKEVEIRDCYTLPSVIFRLMKKADGTLNFIDNASKSVFLFGADNHITDTAFYLLLTPRSNIISSYYDTPALNAPITFQNVLSMLKNLFQVYWHIDEQNYLHFEHISYYMNGMSYTEGDPELLIDLESHIHTNTKENKCFGQNKIKYEKTEMPETYKFGFDDTQTRPFDGYALKCLDEYVSKGSQEEKMISKFDTDVDMILATPSEFNKEGFVLLACPYVEGSRRYVLGIKNKFKIVDEDGDAYRYSLQNYDCAVAYIQKYWWRYNLPCENINVNNEDTNALSTGKYKLQTVEFADTVLAEILADVDNCNKVIRTQQGDGKIKTLSINLNSLAAKAYLLFNFVGRWYYLRGTALGASLTISVNGETKTISVGDNKFTYRYKEPIAALSFSGTDVVSVDFSDCDKLDSLTSADDMFKNCDELLAVDFGNKRCAAVTTAANMFKGCSALTTLVCPETSTWKPDIDFSDCPDLTLDSYYTFIKYLYVYDSGTHLITPNGTFWSALDADTKDDLIAKAQARGWDINIPAANFITGHSNGSTVYATINGSSVEIPVSAGAFSYGYNTPITSLKFENDTNLTDIDFSLSDGLAGVTSLADCFKGCTALTGVDFTGCDLSNVATASDCFAGCTSLAALTIPTGTWKPDIDLSACAAFTKAAMLAVIDGLYTYASGTHTVTFNSTAWDALSQADQQQVYNAADAKGWTTNAVAVTYVISGTSSNVNGTETFNIQFIQDNAQTPDPAETITVNVDANGDWSFEYSGKKIYSLYQFAYHNATITSIEIDEELNKIVSAEMAFELCTILTTADFSNCELKNITTIKDMFYSCSALTSVDFSNATFENLNSMRAIFYNCIALVLVQFSANLNLNNLTILGEDSRGAFYGCKELLSIDFSGQQFLSVTTARDTFKGCLKLQSINLNNAIFPNCTTAIGMFMNCKAAETISLPLATFASCTSFLSMFEQCTNLQTVSMPSVTAASLTISKDIFYNDKLLTSVTLSSATYSNVTDSRNMFYLNNALTTIDVPQNSTAILPTSSATNAYINLGACPLTYASMLKVANWLSDLTGQTAHTVTFKTSAWNALTAAEQSNIDTILSGKNWTRAIA